jgi:hypothetical protein
MNKKLFLFLFSLVFCGALTILSLPLHAAYVYQLEPFTNNGHNSGDLDLYVVVSSPQTGQVDFTFHNASPIFSAIARIYFDNDSLLSFSSITEGAGTSFSQTATPHNLPAAKMLEPDFVAIRELSFDSGPARPHNAINPGEWLQISFNLKSGATLAGVLDYLDTGALRIGAHVIALPACSSESVITVPEPATVALLGLGTLFFLRKRRS